MKVWKYTQCLSLYEWNTRSKIWLGAYVRVLTLYIDHVLIHIVIRPALYQSQGYCFNVGGLILTIDNMQTKLTLFTGHTVYMK